MTKILPRKTLFTLTVLQCFLVVITELSEIFFEKDIFKLDAPLHVASVIGQGLMNIGLLVPILLVSAYQMWKRHSTIAFFMWLGTMFYMLYMWVCWNFTLRFNHLFLAYTAILGLTFYAVITALVTVNADAVKDQFAEGAKTRVAVIFLAVIAAL